MYICVFICTHMYTHIHIWNNSEQQVALFHNKHAHCPLWGEHSAAGDMSLGNAKLDFELSPVTAATYSFSIILCVSLHCSPNHLVVPANAPLPTKSRKYIPFPPLPPHLLQQLPTLVFFTFGRLWLLSGTPWQSPTGIHKMLDCVLLVLNLMLQSKLFCCQKFTCSDKQCLLTCSKFAVTVMLLKTFTTFFCRIKSPELRNLCF